MAPSPTISVVVPAYNIAHLIGETLDSVLAQTRKPDEIVVVDDGSTDDTAAVVEQYAPAVRLLRQENAGCGAAFNTAIRAANGDYVALCPADDLWEPHKLEWQTETLAEHPEIDVSFGHAVTFGTREEEYGRPPRLGIQDPDELRRRLFVGNCIADPTTVVRHELYERIGYYWHGPSEDYEFWLRALRNGAVFHYEPRLVTRLRWHGGNLSSQTLKQGYSRLEVHELYVQDLADEAFARRMLAADHHFIGRAHMGVGELREARAQFREALRLRFGAKSALFAGILSVPGSHALVRAAYAARRRLSESRRARPLARGSEATS